MDMEVGMVNYPQITLFGRTMTGYRIEVSGSPLLEVDVPDAVLGVWMHEISWQGFPDGPFGEHDGALIKLNIWGTRICDGASLKRLIADALNGAKFSQFQTGLEWDAPEVDRATGEITGELPPIREEVYGHDALTGDPLVVMVWPVLTDCGFGLKCKELADVDRDQVRAEYAKAVEAFRENPWAKRIRERQAAKEAARPVRDRFVELLGRWKALGDRLPELLRGAHHLWPDIDSFDRCPEGAEKEWLNELQQLIERLEAGEPIT